MSSVDFKFGTAWSQRLGNEINFQFLPPDCPNNWVSASGNVIPINLSKVRTEHQGNRVPIVFECGFASDFTFFAGFIELPEGASASAVLATIQSLSVSYGDGAEFDYDLTVAPAIVLGLIDNGEGAAVAPVPLWTQANIKPLFYDGGDFEFDFTPTPPVVITIDNRDGGSGSFVISTALQFGLVANYDGASVSVVIGTLDNWYLYDGGTLNVSLATDATFKLPVYGGEYTSVDLSVFPSEGMGIFRAYADAAVSVDMILLVAVILYPNEIKDPGWFNWDITGQISIDLNNGSCCPINDSPIRIELTDGPAADQRYDGDKTVMTMELSTRQRFAFNMYAGEYFSAINPNFFAFQFWGGEQGFITAVQYDRYNFNLCKGNFIPDGDHVDVELVSTDLSNCSSDLMFDGGEAHLEIQSNPHFHIPLPEGALLQFDILLEVVYPWLFNFYGGEYVVISNPEFELPNYDGEMMFFAFADIVYVAYSGESMTIDHLVTDYSVEFLEQGCLDNEFVPMNENGDADLAKFNPVPVELDQYVHSILARCF